jgi:hypothetical protein
VKGMEFSIQITELFNLILKISHSTVQGYPRISPLGSPQRRGEAHEGIFNDSIFRKKFGTVGRSPRDGSAAPEGRPGGGSRTCPVVLLKNFGLGCLDISSLHPSTLKILNPTVQAYPRISSPGALQRRGGAPGASLDVIQSKFISLHRGVLIQIQFSCKSSEHLE